MSGGMKWTGSKPRSASDRLSHVKSETSQEEEQVDKGDLLVIDDIKASLTKVKTGNNSQSTY